MLTMKLQSFLISLTQSILLSCTEKYAISTHLCSCTPWLLSVYPLLLSHSFLFLLFLHSYLLSNRFVPDFGMDWGVVKAIALPILNRFTGRTNGSSIRFREPSLAWSYYR
jgi:hypothetical protein